MANHFLLLNRVVDNTIEKFGPAKAISDNAMHWKRKEVRWSFILYLGHKLSFIKKSMLSQGNYLKLQIGKYLGGRKISTK